MIATPAEHEAELLRAAAEIELARIRASIAGAKEGESACTCEMCLYAAAIVSSFASHVGSSAARHCPQCGQPITVADTPAGADEWPPRSGWRERGSLL